MLSGANLIQWSSGTKCGVVRLIGDSSAFTKGPKGSTVVHGWIGASNVAKELQTSGTDDVCEWWLVSVGESSNKFIVYDLTSALKKSLLFLFKHDEIHYIFHSCSTLGQISPERTF